MIASSRMDFLVLAKAEPISRYSNVSVITYLRTKECCAEEIPAGDLWPVEREAHAGAGFSRVGLHGPVGDPCQYSSSVKDCTPMEESDLQDSRLGRTDARGVDSHWRGPSRTVSHVRDSAVAGEGIRAEAPL
ncbi:hypothetical protein BTVI_50390 [Pitangus sulphuratus]|nr:hypothetical protein BTVI_50390 [Pitangus sulphuratus]